MKKNFNFFVHLPSNMKKQMFILVKDSILRKIVKDFVLDY
jgi:hypothetical protein